MAQVTQRLDHLKKLFLATMRSSFFLWNIFGNIGPLFFALFALPYIYGHSSREYVGFLAITWAAIGYTGIFDFGLSRALFYFSALSKTDRSVDLKDALIKSALIALCVAVIINATLFVFKAHLQTFFAFTDSDQIQSIAIIAISLPVYLISNMVRSSLEGLELFKEANIFKFISYVSLFACPALLIASNDVRLSHVCAAYALVRAAACAYAMRALLPHLRHEEGDATVKAPIPVRDILGFGGWATVSSTISPLMVYGDRLALAYFGGAAAIAIYAILQEFIGKTILLSASYVTAIQPRLGYLPHDEAAALYRREHRNVILLSLILYAAILITSPGFVAVWLNVSLGEVAFLAIVMSIGFMFNSMAQAPLAYLLARGRPRRVAYSHVVEALIYFPSLGVAAMYYGVPGAAVVGVFRQMLDYGILSWQAHREIG